MSDWLAVLPNAVLAIGVYAAVHGVVNAVLSLRAKQRARAVLRSHPSMLASVADLPIKRGLSAAEAERVRQVIEEAAKELSPKDRERIHQGMSQSSKTGERRYIADLVSS